jgi:hypothetical protein
MKTSRTVGLLSALATGALALAACGEADSGETTTVVAAEAEVPTEVAPPSDAETAGPVESVETSIAGRPMTLEITELQREGEFVRLSFTVANNAGEPSDVFYRSFDDNGKGTAADGLQLIDPATGTDYRVVRNPSEGCLCSDELPFTLEAGQEVSLFATFEAPPSAVSQLDVGFPGSVGTITGVPLS